MVSFTVSFAGPMGAGKSTILEKLRNLKHDVMLEPVDRWTEWLEAFYGNQPRYACLFQMRVLFDCLRMRETLVDEPTEPWCFIERSPEESMCIFAKALRPLMTDFEWQLYSDAYDYIGWKPDAVLYLRVSPDVAWKRVGTRNRESETEMTRAYLDDLIRTYDEYYLKRPKCIVVDADGDPDEVFQRVTEALRTMGCKTI